MAVTRQTTLGLIVGNRNFFPDHLCIEGRETLMRVMAEEGIVPIALGGDDTPFGSVENLDHAVICSELFRQHAADLDGFVITLPNFGDERAVANSIRLSGLDLPVLLHAWPDNMGRMDQANRRDSFCGKLSVANNLHQFGIKVTPTTLHTVDPTSDSFRSDLRAFAATCRVVKGLRRARIGALGARPAAFNTVRYSEKLFERAGISVETLDLSEAVGRANALTDADPAVVSKRAAIADYARINGVPEVSLSRMARFGVTLDRWIAQNRLQASAIQCWTALEEFFGTFPCTLMSMLSDELIPAACETDVAGAVGMYALTLASGRAGALIDWNNNYADDPDKGVVFHCSNLPAQIFTDIPVMDMNPGVAASFGKEQAYGVMFGRISASPFTYLRVATDDSNGTIRAYLGEGELTADPLDTFGGYGVAHIPDFQGLLRYIIRNGFEHHVAITQDRVGGALQEALGNYLGWPLYYHG